MKEFGELKEFLDAIPTAKLLSRKEEAEYARRIRLGDMVARDEFAVSNLRLVVACAKGFQGRGLSINDLVQCGCIGLMEAIERFRPTVGKFSTYGVWWIRQAIRRGLQQTSRTIYLPAHVSELVIRAYYASEGLRQALGREPDFDDVKHALRGSLSVRNLKYALGSQTSSLDAKKKLESDGRDSSFTEAVPSPREESPIAVIERMERRAIARELLGSLKPRMRLVLIRRFGLLGGEPWTLQRIARELRISRERVRQLEREALMLLRSTAALDGSPPRRFGRMGRGAGRRKKA